MVKAKTGGSDDTKQSVPTAYVLSYCKEPKNIIQSVTEFVKIKLILDYSSWSRAGVHIDVNPCSTLVLEGHYLTKCSEITYVFNW